MISFKLLGHVFPSHKGLSFTYPYAMNAEKFGLRYSFQIIQGRVEVEIEAEQFDPDTINIALLIMRTQLAAVVSLYVFATGDPYTLHFDKVIPPGSTEEHVLDLSNPDLAALCTAFDPHGAMVGILDIVLLDPELMNIVNDAAMALTTNLYQPIACGRALDGIRNYITPESGEKAKQKQGWQRMSEQLNLSDDYARRVNETAHKPRHRAPHDFEDVVIPDVLRRTWTITNRFLIWCQRGQTRLTAPEFPLL